MALRLFSCKLYAQSCIINSNTNSYLKSLISVVEHIKEYKKILHNYEMI